MTLRKDLSGLTFERWAVVGISHFKPQPSPSRPNRRIAMWLCMCECGNVGYVEPGDLVGRKSKSCGCLRVESVVSRSFRHGHSRVGQRHPLYCRWQAMLHRCRAKQGHAYTYYASRGIKVCARWKDFQNFIDDVESLFKRGLTIDRKDNNGNYEPSNCRWATPKQQAANRRPKTVK